jgi:molecular chaperone GrpE
MNKQDLEKLAFDNPNDFFLGGKVRQAVQDEALEVTEVQPDWKDMYLRSSAEFENFRKRVSKEKEELSIRVKTSMIEPILDLDNDLAIALKHSNDEGLKIIIAKLTLFLQTQGIQTIQTQAYDENIHEVVSVLPIQNPPHVSGSIIDVVSKGYNIGDKIIRYPKVIISE